MSILLITLTAVASAAQYRFDSWTIDDGLPQNSVRDIIQTRDGYLWLATLDGLVRFDGNRFAVFDKSTHPALVTTRFRCLAEADDGALWIGTENNGVLRFAGNVFTNLTVSDGLPSDNVLELFTDDQRRLVIRTKNGLAYFADGKVVPEPDNKTADERLTYYNPARNSRWQIEYPNVITRHNSTGTSVFRLPMDIQFVNQVRMFERRDGSFVVSVNGRLVRFRDGETEIFDEPQGYSGNAADFLEDAEGVLWIGVGDRGIFQMRGDEITRVTTSDGLSSNFIASLFQDREGTVWVGTENRGLNRLQKQFIRSMSSRDGLPGVNSYPILHDRRGRTWIGFQDARVAFIENGKPQEVDFYGVRTIAEDNRGAIWMFGQDVLRFYDDKGLSPPVEQPPEMHRRFVHAIQTDKTGALWFSTVNGLFRLKDLVWTHFDKSNALPTNEIRFIHESPRGDFYVATFDGLAVMKPENSGEITLSRFLTTNDGLGSNHIRSIYEESDGTVWIGTYDGGISRRRGDRIVTFRAADGLFSNGVFAIVEDDAGNFWMSSNQGIHRVSKGELNDFADGRLAKLNGAGYGKRDGMLNAECNGDRQPSSAKLPDGTIWFPTQDGVAIVDPKRLSPNRQAPPVNIENVLVNRDTVASASPVQIKQGSDDIEIRYTAPSFIRSEQIRFRYRIEGLNEQWIDAGTRRDVYFSYLPAGRYVFRVTAANADGVWNETGTSFEFHVVPPFYKTWWFISLIAFLVVLTVFLLYRSRVRQLQRERRLAEEFAERLIESQERERGRIAAELHDGLSQSLAIIKNRATVSLAEPSNPGRAFDQLAEIESAAIEAIDEAKEIIYDLRPVQLDRLGLSKAIAAMLRRVSETSGIAFESSLADLDGALSTDAENSLYRILQEAVNNIMRHSGASHAQVSITKDIETIKVRVTDNGRGFDVNAPKPETGGFGLVGIRERARLLGGEALVKSEREHGTTLEISIPLRK